MSKKPILFCTQCGAPVERKIPEGDDHERYVCTACGEIFYENPLNIVGTLPVWEDRVLLCRRAIDPRLWTLYWKQGHTLLPAEDINLQPSLQLQTPNIGGRLQN